MTDEHATECDDGDNDSWQWRWMVTEMIGAMMTMSRYQRKRNPFWQKRFEQHAWREMVTDNDDVDNKCDNDDADDENGNENDGNDDTHEYGE